MHFKRCFKNILSSIFSCFWWYGQSIFICYFEGNIIRYGVFGMDDSKNFIFASVFKIFYVIFLSLFVNLLFVCVCVFFFFLFFFFPAFLFDSGDFPRKCVQLWKGLFLYSLTDFYFPKICVFDSQEVKFDTGTAVQF